MLLDAYEWLVCHLLESTAAELERLTATGQDAFTAKNNAQVRPISFHFSLYWLGY